MPPIRATIWNEFVHEKTKPEVGRIYPEGLHRVIAAGLTARLGAGVEVRLASLEEPEHGLTPAVLAATDVLFWWGHGHHEQRGRCRGRARAAAGLGGDGVGGLAFRGSCRKSSAG